LEALRHGPRSVGEVASTLPVTRPAVSQHLGVLTAAGLVTHDRAGTRRLYRLAPAGLEELRLWVEALWDDALASFAAAAESPDAPPVRTDRPTPTGPEEEEP
jgi:DNA-binding transcriptional ArsR family regulator